METILRRAVATRASGGNAAFLLTWFTGCIGIEDVHPLEGGFLRLKFRRDRRPTMPIEPVWSFYPKFILETLVKNYKWVALFVSLRRIYLRIKKDPKRYEYTDLALTPGGDETDTLEMFQSDAAHAYVDQEKRLARARIDGTSDKPPLVAAE
jgi:hypothetical protein